MHPLNIRLVAGFKEASKDLSLRDSMRWLLEQLKVEVRISSGRYLSAGPHIILCNHHSPLDGVTMLSTIDRDDLYFIGGQGYQILGERVIEKHLPVFSSGKWDPNFKERLRYNIVCRFTERLTREQALAKNRQAIAKACQIVSGGSAILMAPAGGTWFSGRWKSGIGHLVNGIDNPDTQIQFVKLSGGSRRDIFRYLNPHVFGVFLKPCHLSVEISEPIRLVEVQDRTRSPKNISLSLKSCVDKLFESF